MKSLLKVAAITLVMVALLWGATSAKTSPWGRNGLGGLDTDDHPWGGDQVTPDPNPGGNSGTLVVVSSGNPLLDKFLECLFSNYVRRNAVTLHPITLPRSTQPNVPSTPTLPNTPSSNSGAGGN
ncbi:MAG TPA: hypothetical protein VMS71_01830 [Candidatus Acidoferrum sp.]|nr:hypothetical protein [Candidatus Acidoferrum sp.]